MAVRKDLSKNKWLAEAYIRGKRIRKLFNSKAEANRFYYSLKQENSTNSDHKKVACSLLRLSALVKLWFDLHGRTLANGKTQYNKLLMMSKAMGDPIAKDFTAEHFAEYRGKRLSGEICFARRKGKSQVTEATVNLEHKILKAVFNNLKRFKKWQGDNPIGDIKQFNIQEAEIRFLRSEEIRRLLVACEQSNKPDLGIVVRLCLATGARWSEVANLTASQLIPYKVTFINTKSRKNRTVPILPELYQQITLKNGKLFDVRPSDFDKALRLANIELPENKCTHVLRHTFASHFMMNGGNILVLRDILGHSDIKMTMIYAHFTPSYLETATTLNPLTNLANPMAV